MHGAYWVSVNAYLIKKINETSYLFPSSNTNYVEVVGAYKTFH